MLSARVRGRVVRVTKTVEQGVDSADGGNFDCVWQAAQQALAYLLGAPGRLVALGSEDGRLDGFGQLVGLTNRLAAAVAQAF